MWWVFQPPGPAGTVGAPRSLKREGGREDVAAEGGASSSFRCFFKAHRDADECNYAPIKDKDVTREGATTQQLTMRQAREGEGAASIKSVFYPRMNRGDLRRNFVQFFVENSKKLLMTAPLTFNFKHSLYILFFLNQRFNTCISLRFLLQLRWRHSSWFKDMNSVLQNPELLVSTFLVENTRN